MKHLKCGGNVNEKAIVPYCDKCGKSKNAVLRDNEKASAAPAAPAPHKTAPPKTAPKARAAPRRRTEDAPPAPAPKAKSDKPWWNTKRFDSEIAALNHHCEEAEALGLEGNSLWMQASREAYNPKTYERVIAIYNKAAAVAEKDEDGVTAAIYGSMEGQIRSSAEQHAANPTRGLIHDVGED